MEKYKKRNSIILLILGLVFVLCNIALVGLAKNIVWAQQTQNEPYFCVQLDELSKKFYFAIKDLLGNESAKTGTFEYDLIKNNVLSAEQIESYKNGGKEILMAYGAGRDAFAMDNADNFFVDFSNLSISIGTKNGEYVATLGTGRTDNYLVDASLSKAEIDTAQSAMLEKIDLLLDGTNYPSMSASQRAILANRLIVDNTEYSFCNSSDERQFEPYIRTAYGALVGGKAVCEGYARATKMLLDKMQVENVLVYGYLLSNQGAFEPHMWNCVKIDNKWYAIDSTVSDGKSGDKKYQTLQGSDTFDYDHIAEGKVSEADFSFSYPMLSKYDYGKEPISTTISYVDNGDSKMLNAKLSFNGKNATKLAQDGLFLAYNYSTQTSTANNITWTNFSAITYAMPLFPYLFEEPESTYTIFKDTGTTPFIKFAIINRAPDSELGTYTSLTDEDIVCQSDTITIENYDGYVASPFANKVSPANNAKLDINKTYHIVLTYDERLVKTDENDVQISVASTHNATDADYSLKNVVWDATKNQLSFDFAPSKMFLHNGDGYNFMPTNLVGANSKKSPHAVSYSFQYTSIICNKILDDGKLYMNLYGHPQLIDNSDLSMNNWTLNGEQVGQNQRSQLALVVTSTSQADNADMTSSIASTQNVDSSAILSSSTFEIDLDLCGCLTTVPNGSYMKINFGFPQGYSAKDKGVTFKLYHFKRDSSGKIDPSKTVEIACVVTEYGLVAEINDFSPFAIVAFDAKAVQNTTKGIYSRVIGTNGTIKVENTQSNTAFLQSGQSVTFALDANTGYKTQYVLLNQKKIAVNNGKITLSYDELQDNNVLEACFVASRVAEFEETNQIQNLQQNFSQNVKLQAKNTNSPILIVVCLVAVATVAIFAILLVAKSKKNQASKSQTKN